MLRTLPVPFIIDHMGRVPTKDGLEQEPFKILLNVARMDNCWVKICGAERISSMGPPFTDAVPFGQALLKVAPDRILWGTDWPHPNIKKHMPNDGDLVDLIPLFMPDPALQRKVLVDNPHRLYGFSRADISCRAEHYEAPERPDTLRPNPRYSAAGNRRDHARRRYCAGNPPCSAVARPSARSARRKAQ